MKVGAPTVVAFIAGAVLLISFFGSNADTSGNFVPTSRAEEDIRIITVDDKKPQECAATSLATYLGGSGTINGAASAELITGSSAGDTIRGRNGSDCILGGDGNDSLRGDGGTDVCIGGPGTDTFDSTCETRIQ